MHQFKDICLHLVLLAATTLSLPALSAEADYVIQISVDGLRSDAVTALGPSNAPNFYRLRREGVFTDNARTDVDATVTLPNHTTQITGRGVAGASGHNYTSNGTPVPTATLHTNKGAYISSTFDVAHDNGLSTCLYVSKEKFIIYEQSYNDIYGASDKIGIDNGRNKIDAYLFSEETADLITAYLNAMTRSPYNYCMLHLRDPDAAGHDSTWNVTPGSGYLNAVARIDHLLGKVLTTIENDPTLNRRTTIIITSDHGGRSSTTTHQPFSDAQNYTIPFYVWGAGAATRADLYTLNATGRAAPGTRQPAYSEPVQPIRNGDAANLALQLLGFGSVPNSSINVSQDLNIAP